MRLDGLGMARAMGMTRDVDDTAGDLGAFPTVTVAAFPAAACHAYNAAIASGSIRGSRLITTACSSYFAAQAAGWVLSDVGDLGATAADHTAAARELIAALHPAMTAGVYALQARRPGAYLTPFTHLTAAIAKIEAHLDAGRGVLPAADLVTVRDAQRIQRRLGDAINAHRHWRAA